jgi:hypothetical protein
VNAQQCGKAKYLGKISGYTTPQSVKLTDKFTRDFSPACGKRPATKNRLLRPAKESPVDRLKEKEIEGRLSSFRFWLK